MSKQQFVLTLTDQQLAQACEQYASKLFDPAMYQHAATVQQGSKVVVTVARKRAARKGKAAA